MNSLPSSTAAARPIPAWNLNDSVLVAILAVATLAAFHRVLYCDFVDWDDQFYICQNAHLRAGLSGAGVWWALTGVLVDFWVPVTSLSLLLDFQLFGLQPWGYHLTNLLWHTVNVLLAFILFRRWTGQRYRSFVAAALFALHPLRVESVAWVTERKDVLSIFFGLLALLAYGSYAARPGLRRYLTLMTTYAFSLMSKPMLVTLPCLLLLLDYWPLHRWHLTGWRALRTVPSPVPLWRLLVEKIPLLALSVAFSAVVINTQQTGARATYPLSVRAANAIVAYVRYLEMTVAPFSLAAHYPYMPESIAPWRVALSLLVLAGISAATVWWRARQPALIVGWCWYLGTLLPVIGLVPFGMQTLADRFTYFPSLGLAVAFTWCAAEALLRLHVPAPAQLGLAGLVVVALAGTTFAQVKHWKNAETVWQHALDVTANNDLAHSNIGLQRMSQGRWAEARQHFQAAVDLGPKDAGYHFNLGVAAMLQGEDEFAAAQFQQTLDIQPDYYQAAYYLGTCHLRQKEFAQAGAAFQRALDIDPSGANAVAGLGQIHWQQGRRHEAAREFVRALRLKGTEAEALNGLGLVRLREQYEREAADLFAAAVQAEPSLIEAHNNLGIALRRLGSLQDAAECHQKAVVFETKRQAGMTRTDFTPLARYCRRLAFVLNLLGKSGEAAGQFAEALRLDPTWPQKDTQAAWCLATAPKKQDRDVSTAWELASMSCQAVANPPPEAFDALAAANAAAGWFEAATSAARKALAVAPPAKRQEIAERVQKYEAGLPYVAPQPRD